MFTGRKVEVARSDRPWCSLVSASSSCIYPCKSSSGFIWLGSACDGFGLLALLDRGRSARCSAALPATITLDRSLIIWPAVRQQSGASAATDGPSKDETHVKDYSCMSSETRGDKEEVFTISLDVKQNSTILYSALQ